MRIKFDQTKRDKALAERGLDFADAEVVFAGVTVEIEDTRKNCGEPRIICYGLLAGRMVIVGYTPRVCRSPRLQYEDVSGVVKARQFG